MPDQLPPQPTDVFTRLTDTMDGARGVLQGVGLRPYRAFFVRERWEGPDRGEGALLDRIWTEITPSPKVRVISASRVASSGGIYLDGSVELLKVSRRYRREDIVGRGMYGDPLPRNETFAIALLAAGQLLAELYNVQGEPVLSALEWRMVLRPLNQRLPGPS